MAERFTEHSLLDDVIATWGQYGAHADLCRWLIDEVARLRAAADEIERLRAENNYLANSLERIRSTSNDTLKAHDAWLEARRG